MATRTAKPKLKDRTKKPTASAAPLLTEKQIEKRYPNQWVLLLDIVDRPGPVLVKARVAAHSENREVIDRTVKELQPTKWGVFHTGPCRGDYLL